MPADRPVVSVVIPVYNEEACLPALFVELGRMTSRLSGPAEFVFVNDGSSDGSLQMLRDFRSDNAIVKVIDLAVNFGQHAAIMAGLGYTSGEVVVTLDADLQNPPDEVPALVAKISEGYDVVAGWRRHRRDPLSRKIASWAMNRLVGLAPGHFLHDYGCMLRAYSRTIVDAVNQCPERHTYLPVLANSFARRIVEVEVGHAERQDGASKYSWSKLWRLNIDLFTGLTALPLHWVSLGGLTVAVLGLAFAVFLFIRRLVVGPEVEGTFTLFAILFFFVGCQLLAIGLIGEYLTRIYDEVRGRPRFIVHDVYRSRPDGGQVPVEHGEQGEHGADR